MSGLCSDCFTRSLRKFSAEDNAGRHSTDKTASPNVNDLEGNLELSQACLISDHYKIPNLITRLT